MSELPEFFRVTVPKPEPVEGRVLPVYEVEEPDDPDRLPGERPMWVRVGAAILAAIVVVGVALAVFEVPGGVGRRVGYRGGVPGN